MCQKFYRLKEAMDAALLDSNMSVFSKETSFDGKRFFLLSTKDYFWSFYQNLPNAQKKYFEVISPGKLILNFLSLENPMYFTIWYGRARKWKKGVRSAQIR